MEQAPPIPQATPQSNGVPQSTNVNISTPETDKSGNLLIIFGVTALGLFILGNMIFTISNYVQVKNLKKQMELNKNKQPKI